MAHTPTPWKFSPWHIEEGPSAVRAPEGYIVCTTASDADAAFIVRACNAHGDLVAALRLAHEFIANGVEFGFIRMPDFQDDPEYKTLPVIGAALSKARGE